MQAPEEDRAGLRQGRAAEKPFPALGDSAGAARGQQGPLPLCPWRSLGTEVPQREACGADERRLVGVGGQDWLSHPETRRRRSFLAPPTVRIVPSLLLVLPNQKKGT